MHVFAPHNSQFGFGIAACELNVNKKQLVMYSPTDKYTFEVRASDSLGFEFNQRIEMDGMLWHVKDLFQKGKSLTNKLLDISSAFKYVGKEPCTKFNHLNGVVNPQYVEIDTNHGFYAVVAVETHTSELTTTSKELLLTLPNLELGIVVDSKPDVDVKVKEAILKTAMETLKVLWLTKSTPLSTMDINNVLLKFKDTIGYVENIVVTTPLGAIQVLQK